ncbi:hypothetical protein [Saccharicrinis sp. FJH54]|uniref:hypothetical protein n=1 Tax=Saccharicrinis sp. FJH54 TaxID=3344665 RepID=UPI0035D4AC2E
MKRIKTSEKTLCSEAIVKMFPVFFLLFFSSCSFSHSQVKSDPVLQEQRQYEIYEKIYLHTDHALYQPGDDIWFKSYLVEALSNQLTTHSKVVYVDLISPDAIILDHQTIRQINGTGSGAFHLPEHISPGQYYLRAYTAYMNNFGGTFFFMKKITVKDFADTTAGESRKNHHIPAVDIQFFPEGGSLVCDIYSKIAFKAVNANGYGCDVSGYIISSQGDTVSAFKSEHLGLGKFYLKPAKDFDYYATGMAGNGVGFKVKLPTCFETGLVIRLKPSGRSLILNIGTNAKTLPLLSQSPLILRGTFRNQAFFETTLDINQSRYLLPERAFPEGIIKLTIYGNDTLPLCERLFYVEHPNALHLSVKTKKSEYLPREKTDVELAISDTTEQPVYANLSMAVIDRNFADFGEPYSSNIASWFFLESEIKGYVEQPGYYFDPSQANRKEHLDLLLLTQGWRDFLWKYVPSLSGHPEYKPEQGLTISGRLRHKLFDNPIPDANIALGIFSGNNRYFQHTQTDSMGKYTFEGLNFMGEATVVLSATNDKQNTIGWILPDSQRIAPPQIYFANTAEEKFVPAIMNNIAEDALYKKMLKTKYRLTDTILIKEVTVKGDVHSTAKNDGNFRMYGNPDNVINIHEEDLAYFDIFDLIQSRIPAFSVESTFPDIKISFRGGGSPLFLLDGIVIDADWVSTIPLDNVDKIEILKGISGSAAFGMSGNSGVISVFTKKNSATPSDAVLYHSVSEKITGYASPRIFYSPDYKIHTLKDNQPDLRSTIYWEPDINISNTVPAKITFYNADLHSTIYIDVQGITQTGVPISGKAIYEVKD